MLCEMTGTWVQFLCKME